jgi:hypothetical protein
LPHLKSSYAKYQSDPNVAFLLVSLDKDPKRLQRYLDEMQFPFPVARAAQEHIQQAMGIDDVPATFYVDSDGIVRYEANGVETHGDSPARVEWFVDQLKNRH